MSHNSAGDKTRQLEKFRCVNTGQVLTTDTGLKVTNTDDSLKAGMRGPTLLEDFHLRQKITHFDHERIPERVVHARGTGAHGYFELYESLAEYTTAAFLQDPKVKTPVFVRFSTVVGSKGSADTVRDVRGFATKFYTTEGNLDIVGNNMPVFFIQDAMKFPDFVHAVKPEPNTEMPQATTAHDTFWDFVVNTPETAHMVMWAMSDRAIPRSYRMMEGFGVNTFRFINAQGKARFVKYHWKPVLGVHSLMRDEAQKLSGKDPDFHRRDLWDAIEQGNYPEYELGLQIIEEDQEFNFDFDILDATKLWPEEDVPVKIVGKMTLNKNVDNFFAETEQIAFCPANLVPGIDFSNDPLLQGRLFSYEDTQLSRLGGPNFKQIPINKPIVPVHNSKRDGLHQTFIHPGPVSYTPNSLDGDSPLRAGPNDGYVHYAQKVEGHVVRARSESFNDHYTQAALFWNSMSTAEREHIIDAFHFEVGSVKDKTLVQRVVDMFSIVSGELGTEIAHRLGMNPPAKSTALACGKSSPALSQDNTIKTVKTLKTAILIENGCCIDAINALSEELKAQGASVELISCNLSPVASSDGTMLPPAKDFTTAEAIMYDAVFLPGGTHIETFAKCSDARNFINEALHHAKTIGATGEGAGFLSTTDASAFLENFDYNLESPQVFEGIVILPKCGDYKAFAVEFANQLAMIRHFARHH